MPLVFCMYLQSTKFLLISLRTVGCASNAHTATASTIGVGISTIELLSNSTGLLAVIRLSRYDIPSDANIVSVERLRVSLSLPIVCECTVHVTSYTCNRREFGVNSVESHSDVGGSRRYDM